MYLYRQLKIIAFFGASELEKVKFAKKAAQNSFEIGIFS